MRFRLLLILVLSLTSIGLSTRGIPAAVETDAASLREANRVLEEESKLAARPQIYLLIDLPEQVLRIKGRGIELHRLPITGWSASDQEGLRRVFRLQARPMVSRPRTLPESDPLANPIDLKDMPLDFDLAFDPPLILTVAPPARERPLLLARSFVREWWGRLASHVGGSTAPTGKVLRFRLTLSQEAARSLAWSLTDGMPLLIRTP